MPRQSLTPKKSTHQKHSPLDSVSASELLKALHTLESINIIQEQIDEDLNISFSQKDNFSQDGFHEVDKSPLKNTQKNNRPTNQANGQKPKNAIENKENLESMAKSGKMNFEFYMSKKDNVFGLKNRTKSPRPSHQAEPNSQFKKTFEPATSSKKANQNNKTLNPHSTNRTDIKNKSLSPSPLTERSMNVQTLQKSNNSTMIVGKELRLKTEANERESIQQQRRHTKTNSSFVAVSRDQNKSFNTRTNKQNRTPRNTNIQLEATKRITDSKKLKTLTISSSNPLHNLSIHQRNKQYMRQKNQRLAKLCQQMQQKKKEEEKQCTFKPKIIANNANIKPKYNDLCVSRELTERGHKKCKQGKQNNEENFCGGQSHNISSNQYNNKTIKCGAKGQKSIKEQTGKLRFDDSFAKPNQETINFDESLGATTPVTKSKYKNSKFNILLDLIH